MGDPDYGASHQGTFGDIDDGPTKSYMMKYQTNLSNKDLFARSFGKLPAEELYDLKKDPDQFHNLSDIADYKWLKEMLIKQLEDYQKKTGDPRVYGESPWDDYPFYAEEKYLRGKYLEEVLNLKK
jgi:uncharacterized sulfatase